jgi:hypothetical protein
MKIADCFKISIIVILVLLLIIIYQYSNNGRYIYHRQFTDSQNDEYVVDTRTGIIYGYTQNKDQSNKVTKEESYEINLLNGHVIYKPLQTTNIKRQK